MERFALAQFRSRPSRTAALGLAILVAAVAFVLLTAAAQTSRLDVQGTVKSNYRAAYDVLVRPRQSANRLEISRRLVRPNFLSGVFGGISFPQYEAVKRIAGVEVAAPIANLGFIFPVLNFGFSVEPYLTREPVQLIRLRLTWLANNDTSRYQDASQYVYYTRRAPMLRYMREVHGADTLSVCTGFSATANLADPFARSGYLSCYSSLTPGVGHDNVANFLGLLPPRAVGAEIGMQFPLFVSAIDPVQEARLLGLDKAIVSGRYLRPTEPVRLLRTSAGAGYRASPVIASRKTFVDERLRITVERLHIPPDARVSQTLASRRARPFLTSLSGRVADRAIIGTQELYDRLLRKQDVVGGSLASAFYWTTSDVRYRIRTKDLAPAPADNPRSIWRTPVSQGGFWSPSIENQDVQFRGLSPHISSWSFDKHNTINAPGFDLVGQYDPERLPGFSPLSQVPLETYYPPRLEPADAASKVALGGKPLLPTQNLGDYIAQPPLVLTTLQGIRPWLNPKYFSAGGNRLAKAQWRPKAPISAIRIRVRGVTGPDELSQARVRAVAQQIHEKTGLQVDITAGSSPKPLLVDLPAGKFGRPELLLREGWSKKGASISFLRAVDRKSLALFGLVLVVCAFFLGNGALASVRARRSEIGTLMTLGWSRGRVFAAVLLELLLVGVVAGALGVALAALVVVLTSLDLPLWRTLLVLPLAVGLALLAGLLPAWLASRGSPLDAIRPAVSGRERVRRLRGVVGLALLGLRRLPVRTVIGSSGLVIGVAALTILLAIQRAFQGVLVDTLLGNAISVQVRSSDLLAAALTVTLAGLGVADVLYLNLRERAAEFVTLRTVGWSDRHLAVVVLVEGLALGLLGGLTGAALGIGIGALMLGVPLGSLALAALVAAVGGVVVALVASLIPLSQLARLTPPTVLAEE